MMLIKQCLNWLNHHINKCNDFHNRYIELLLFMIFFFRFIRHIVNILRFYRLIIHWLKMSYKIFNSSLCFYHIINIFLMNFKSNSQRLLISVCIHNFSYSFLKMITYLIFLSQFELYYHTTKFILIFGKSFYGYSYLELYQSV